MICPNLLVTDLERSVRFYREKLGMTLELCVAANREFTQDGSLLEDPVFAVMCWNEYRLMLQTGASLAEDLPAVFTAAQAPVASGAVYFQGFDPDSVLDRFGPEEILKGPELTWYGMREVHLRDPDGYVLSLGRPEENAAPA